jgi:hypothetical protein
VNVELGHEWRMYAHLDSGTLTNLGSYPYVKGHGLPYPIVEVLVVLVAENDPSGTHWGWLAKGEDVPSMIWPYWGQYSMCFLYGVRAEEGAGHGRTLRLHVAISQESRDATGGATSAD